MRIICKNDNPLINSHHDIIISAWSPPSAPDPTSTSSNITAPRVNNTRVKISWSEEGIIEYEKLVASQLLRLQNLWLGTPSRSSISLLFQSTNNILTTAAASTNKEVRLNSAISPRSSSTPKPIRMSQKALLSQYKRLKRAEANLEDLEVISNLKNKYHYSKRAHRRLERMSKAQESVSRDEKLHSILSENPSLLYSSLRTSKKCSTGKIQKLLVKDRTYLGETVPDGFYDSISELKSLDQNHLDNSTSYKEFSEDFEHIIQICSKGMNIPPISLKKSVEILRKIKPSVNDLYNITANHYINAGEPGLQHFHLLLSALIHEVSHLTITEVNAVYASILFKGHGKDKSSDRSYRTISICPLVVKALDLYIRDLNMATWNEDQADVQFLGEGSSHELAALLLTEAVQFSLNSIKRPMFALFLDAKSAFDGVLRKILINSLFHCGTEGHSLLYINNRLETRTTYLDWDNQLMGPIKDELGVEQGGANSGDYYKIFGKEQLSTAQASGLGVALFDQIIELPPQPPKSPPSHT